MARNDLPEHEKRGADAAGGATRFLSGTAGLLSVLAIAAAITLIVLTIVL